MVLGNYHLSSCLIIKKLWEYQLFFGMNSEAFPYNFATSSLSSFEHFFFQNIENCSTTWYFLLSLAYIRILFFTLLPPLSVQSTIKLNKNLHSSEDAITILVGGWHNRQQTTTVWLLEGNEYSRCTTLSKVTVIFPLLSFLVCLNVIFWLNVLCCAPCLVFIVP